jgi:hypothetical protein
MLKSTHHVRNRQIASSNLNEHVHQMRGGLGRLYPLACATLAAFAFSTGLRGTGCFLQINPLSLWWVADYSGQTPYGTLIPFGPVTFYIPGCSFDSLASTGQRRYFRLPVQLRGSPQRDPDRQASRRDRDCSPYAADWRQPSVSGSFRHTLA